MTDEIDGHRHTVQQQHRALDRLTAILVAIKSADPFGENRDTVSLKLKT